MNAFGVRGFLIGLCGMSVLRAAPLYLAPDIAHTIVQSLVSRTLHIVLKPGDHPPAIIVTHLWLARRIIIEPLNGSLAYGGPLVSRNNLGRGGAFRYQTLWEVTVPRRV